MGRSRQAWAVCQQPLDPCFNLHRWRHRTVSARGGRAPNLAGEPKRSPGGPTAVWACLGST
ncbi:hypothetical protein DB30_05761 [Enhygromyxa salina]|uniref:Uncharacterized protein n=1 Tax=Enhygromyxa salina TaxID=215803 RepID=A0A0C2D5C8_9BACT|nr:hypothetical protein DB30_05761 [Enhygromyxa salina]